MKLSQKRNTRISYFKYLIIAIFLTISLIALSLYFYFNLGQSSVSRIDTTINKPKLVVTGAENKLDHLPSPNKLVITRPADELDHLPSLTLTITNASRVKKLYDDIYLLPTFVPGINYKCPNDRSSAIYILIFYQDNKLINQAIYKPSGCASVTLHESTPRIVEGSFLSDFQSATGLSINEIYGSHNPL